MSLVDRIFDPNRLLGYETGYFDLDNIIRGIKLGSLTILAGATGMGKSLFALNLLLKLQANGIKTCYFDLENGEETSKKRLLKIKHGLSDAHFENAKNKAQVGKWLEDIGVDYFSHEDIDGDRNEMLRTLVRGGSADKVKVFLVDPLQALETSDGKTDELAEQGKIVRALKELAQKLDVAIIICHHIRKSTSGGGEWVKDIDDVQETRYRIPNLEDLRGSGKITDYATDVWGIVRTISSSTPEARGKTLLRVLKNRNGVQGDVKLTFDEETLRFYGATDVPDGLFEVGGLYAK